MRRYFVTGTGTEIGKTVVAARLVRQFRQLGRSVLALKPVASGVDPAELEVSDPGVLLSSLGRPVNSENVASIAPWCFREPLAPDQAAQRVGTSLDFEAVVRFCRNQSETDVLLIEGVGGVRVPIGRRHSVVDWIHRIDAPAIVVSGTYLGSISHLLTALDALNMAQVEIAGIVLNRSPSEPMPVEEMVEALRPFLEGVPIAEFPRCKDPFNYDEADLVGPLGL